MGKRISTYSVKLVKETSGVYNLESDIVNSSTVAGTIVEQVTKILDSTVEKFGMLCLNSQNKVIGVHIITIGAINACIVSPRDVFQRALLNNACSIILFHNHPGGSQIPSREDKDLTTRMIECGNFLDIKVLDHIIVWDENSYTSFAEQGYLY